MSDISNPLAVLLPYSFTTPQDYPTEVLSLRFQAWRSIIKDLVNYLKEYANVQEEIIRQQLRLQQAVGISTGTGSSSSSTAASSGHNHSSHNNHVSPSHKDDINAINKFFLPIGNGSIQDLPTVLTKFHQQNVSNSSKSLKDINQIIVPKLEELRKDLLVKIKEIKNLQNDFKNTLGKEINETKTLLSQYHHAIEVANKLENSSSSNTSAGDGEHAKNDPYLIKIKLDRQLKKQLSEENYLHEAYVNLQTAGGKLESIIVLEIQNYLKMFLDLLVAEHATIPGFLVPNLTNGFLHKEANFEWDSFISRNLPSPSISISAINHNNSNVKNGTFIDVAFPARKLTDLAIPDFDSPLNIALREGFLERRSKFLKSYSSGWYVLTCNYFHEFKSSDRKKDQVPALSLLLDQCHVSEHSKDDGKPTGVYKFVVYTKLPNGIISKGHNLVFRTDTYKKMIDWYNDIKALTSLPTPAARARYVSKNFNPTISTANKRISRNSSILSSSTTHARSIKSGTTINSKLRIPNNMNSVMDSTSNHLRTVTSNKSVSQVSSGNNNRLSSTFSEKNNNQSPRLTNMINSDGTIITPVNTYSEHDQSNVTYQQAVPVQQYQYQQQQKQQAIPAGGIPIQIQPSQSGYIPASPNFQYYTTTSSEQSQQPLQQFYNPVLQQFYTLSPGVQPQPQFFPTSPLLQPNSQHQFIAVPTTQGSNGQGPNGQAGVYAINTGNYFPQQGGKGNEPNGQLPYPVNSQIHPGIPGHVDHEEIKPKDSEEPVTENGAERVSINNGDVNIIVDNSGDILKNDNTDVDTLKTNESKEDGALSKAVVTDEN